MSSLFRSSFVFVFTLAGISPSALVYSQNDTDTSLIERATCDLRSLAIAIELFQLDNLRVPTTEEGLQILVSGSSRQYLPQVPTGPWGRAYQYVSPGQAGVKFDIFTLGADGHVGGAGVDADIRVKHDPERWRGTEPCARN